MHSAIADKKEELAAVCRHYGVTRLEVFGSAARGTDFDPQTSDADFLVEFDPGAGLTPFDQFFGFAEALSMTLGRTVDLVNSSMHRDPRVLLTDIDQAGADIERFIEGTDVGTYAENVLTQAAVERKSRLSARR